MSARAWAAFAGVSVLWGIPYLFIKIAVDDGVSPWFLSWARIVLAAALLLGLAWQAGKLGSLRGRWRWIALFALIEISLPFPLIATGEQHVSSSLAAILIAAVPLFVALLALRFDHDERVGGARLVGLVVGLGGVVTLVGIDVAGHRDELLGAFAILLAALGGFLVAEAGPARASVITYVAPLVAVGLGVAILDETVGLGAVLGLLLILAGSWLATGGRLPRRQLQGRLPA